MHGKEKGEMEKRMDMTSYWSAGLTNPQHYINKLTRWASFFSVQFFDNMGKSPSITIISMSFVDWHKYFVFLDNWKYLLMTPGIKHHFFKYDIQIENYFNHSNWNLPESSWSTCSLNYLWLCRLAMT